MSIQELPSTDKCSKCGKDINLIAQLGGCTCCRAHPIFSGWRSGGIDHPIDGLYDGYVFYDKMQNIVDNLDSN